MTKDLLRRLPAVDKLLATPYAVRWVEASNRELVRGLLRAILDELRHEVVRGLWAQDDDLHGEIQRRLDQRLRQILMPSLRRVINATGVILHTNLGRAPLAREAVAAIADIATGYANLEYDVAAGRRGQREGHCRALLARLTGSEDAIVANNCAAAVLLVLNTLAEGGEVIVSRGELIEIGGSFRIPDVMEKSGARLREVGTTNRTRVGDYQRAINENTRLILRVHPSNYRILGFTERPKVEELVALGERAGIPVFEDAGSGCLLDLAPYGVIDEPLVENSIKAGLPVVAFSGDKLLGGPQAGIIAGKREIIERVRRNPLMRALRVDKMTYAALEATLRLYERGAADVRVPVIRAMAMTTAEIETRAVSLTQRLESLTNGRLRFSIADGVSVIGGGSAPEVRLPTVVIAVRSRDLTAEMIAEHLRACPTPIIARTESDLVLLDLRTVAVEEEALLLAALADLAQRTEPDAASLDR